MDKSTATLYTPAADLIAKVWADSQEVFRDVRKKFGQLQPIERFELETTILGKEGPVLGNVVYELSGLEISQKTIKPEEGNIIRETVTQMTLDDMRPYQFAWHFHYGNWQSVFDFCSSHSAMIDLMGKFPSCNYLCRKDKTYLGRFQTVLDLPLEAASGAQTLERLTDILQSRVRRNVPVGLTTALDSKLTVEAGMKGQILVLNLYIKEPAQVDPKYLATLSTEFHHLTDEVIIGQPKA
ncbi:MAG: hypothetical protein V1837_04905 [Candidatus Woesearchaeota archaeon]